MTVLADKKTAVLLVLICALAFTLRLPGVFWGVHLSGHPKFLEYISGEDTYVDQAWYFVHGYADKDQDSFYTKGTAFQIALAGFILKPFTDVDIPQLTIVGRFLSAVYGTLTVALLFFLVSELTLNVGLALISALFLAILSLHVLYSCAATTDAGVLFWVYALMYSCVLYLKTDKRRYLIFALISCSLALAIKLAFVALIPVVYIMVKKRWDLKRVLAALAFLYFIFFLANGGTYSFSNFLMTLNNVSEDNLFARDYNKFLNFLCYGIVLLIILKIPSLILIIKGLFQDFGRVVKCEGITLRDLVFILILPPVVQFLSVCSLSYADARHILLFFPLFCALGELGFVTLADWPWFSTQSSRVLVLVCVVAYQLLFLFPTEYSYLFDSRESAASWIRHHVPKGEKIALPRYSIMPSLEKDYKIVSIPDARYVVLHKEYYMRFLRSIANPLEAYPKWQNVFHADRDGFTFCQGVFKGELPYTLVKKFKTSIDSPEALIVNKLMGTMMGYDDVLIYQRNTLEASTAPAR